jgi:hypothetical protein
MATGAGKPSGKIAGGKDARGKPAPKELIKQDCAQKCIIPIEI